MKYDSVMCIYNVHVLTVLREHKAQRLLRQRLHACSMATMHFLSQTVSNATGNLFSSLSTVFFNSVCGRAGNRFDAFGVQRAITHSPNTACFARHCASVPHPSSVSRSEFWLIISFTLIKEILSISVDGRIVCC